MTSEDLDPIFRKSLLHAAIRLTRCPFVAEDLVQETFLRALISLNAGGGPHEGREFWWLLGILRNLWRTERSAAFARRDLVHALGRGKTVAVSSASPESVRSKQSTTAKPTDGLSPRQAEVARRRLGRKPETLQSIANDLNCSVTTVWRDADRANAVLTGGPPNGTRLVAPRK